MKMGTFGLKAPFAGAIGNGSFFGPEPPLFTDFGDFDPCRGSADLQVVGPLPMLGILTPVGGQQICKS